jgi:RNA polymerase sigma-70 factor (ECF subfamily)
MSLPPDSSGAVILTVLYAESREPLNRYALRLTREPGRAEDLVQETFLRAMAHLALLGALEPHQRRAWLFRVLKNLFLDQQRRTGRMDEILRRLAELAAVDDLPVVDAAVYSLIEAAPIQHREVLFRRYMLGQTSQQIGRELDCQRRRCAPSEAGHRLAKAHRDEFRRGALT